MRQRPIVAVMGCNKPLEGETATTVKFRYVDAVARFGECVPMIVPSLARMEDAGDIVTSVDAILLTGSTANIEPHRYKSDEDAYHPVDPARDTTSIALIKAAKHFGVPLFGICRGMQEINVALGGTLIDERRSGEPKWSHHAPDHASLEEMFEHYHPAQVAPASFLNRLTGKQELQINSVHYQMVGELAPGLRVEATADDGVVEAISSREADPLIFAVQWHPEWKPETRQHDMAFWRNLGDMARRRLTQSAG